MQGDDDSEHGDEAKTRLATAADDPYGLRARARASLVSTRLRTVMDWLAGGMQPRPCATQAMREWGLSRRQANRYVSGAIRVLQADDKAEPVESKAARLKAMLYDNIRQAKARTRTYVQDGEPVTEPAPDLAAANQAVAMLAQLELGGAVKR